MARGRKKGNAGIGCLALFVLFGGCLSLFNGDGGGKAAPAPAPVSRTTPALVAPAAPPAPPPVAVQRQPTAEERENAQRRRDYEEFAAARDVLVRQQQEQQRQQNPVPRQQERGDAVYVTETGDKYHRAGCRHLRRSSIPIARGDAQGQGYGACSRCF